MHKLFLSLAAVALVSACTHKVAVDEITVRNETVVGNGAAAAADIRTKVADDTCEAQYVKDKQNYLSAVQTAIALGRANPNAANAPLDAFRAEINAAYNAVVMRCKTHMHCLEVQGYDEARCYMAASDRKDAERRFSDLSEDLRRIDGENKKHGAGKGRKSPPVTITNNNNIKQNNPQTQTNDAQTGPRIEDQDVLVLCGDAKNLLKAKCRQPCPAC